MSRRYRSPLPVSEHGQVAVTVGFLTAGLPASAIQPDEPGADIDDAFMVRCRRDAAGMDYSRTLVETRRLLSHVPGFFAGVIIEEREDR